MIPYLDDQVYEPIKRVMMSFLIDEPAVVFHKQGHIARICELGWIKLGSGAWRGAPGIFTFLQHPGHQIDDFIHFKHELLCILVRLPFHFCFL